MKHPSSSAGLFVAAALVLAVSACAPAVVDVGTAPPTHHRHDHSTPTPTQAATPVVRVPLMCSSLFSDATAASLIGNPIKYHLDQTTTPVNVTDIVARQYGTLVCLWGGQGRTDGGYDANLTVEISPDAAAGFAANIETIESQAESVVTDSAGDRSEYSCGVQGEFQCESNMLVGSFWVSAYLQDLGNGGVPQAIAKSRMQQVLTVLAGALGGVTALPAWTAPGAALPGFCSDPTSTTQIDTALGGTDFGVTGVDDGSADADSYTQLPGIYTQCGWSSAGGTGAFTYLSVAMVKGGAWALSGLSGESNERNYMLGAFSPLPIAGADAAVSSCSTDAQVCEVMLSIGSTLVSIDIDDPGTAQVDAALAKIVADIAAS